jgi:hypothetical protein
VSDPASAVGAEHHAGEQVDAAPAGPPLAVALDPALGSLRISLVTLALGLRVGIGAFAGTALLALSPADGWAAPSERALDALDQTDQEIVNAKGNSGNPRRTTYYEDLRAATRNKILFILTAFKGTTMLGGCDGDELIFLLDRIDVALEQAEHKSGKNRRERLERALKHAKKLDRFIDECAQGVAAGGGDLIKDKVRKLVKQDKEDELSGKELRKKAGKVFKLKRDLLRSQTIEGCDVTELFVQIERVDLLIIRAEETKANDFDGRKKEKKKKAARKRREILERAIDLVRELTRTYRKLPCGPSNDDKFGCSGIKIAPSGQFAHSFTGGSCNQSITTLTFEITSGGTYTAFSVPMPSCALENANRRVRCTAPQSANKMKIQGSSFTTKQANPHCVRTTARNASGEQVQFTIDTHGCACAN